MTCIKYIVTARKCIRAYLTKNHGTIATATLEAIAADLYRHLRGGGKLTGRDVRRRRTVVLRIVESEMPHAA
ncbi:MAG: hypothetical protein H0X04_00295 [Chthoniobacterales bacterium]|nr:hypothetical protein [Chthoniobacterales bacterium]